MQTKFKRPTNRCIAKDCSTFGQCSLCAPTYNHYLDLKPLVNGLQCCHSICLGPNNAALMQPPLVDITLIHCAPEWQLPRQFKSVSPSKSVQPTKDVVQDELRANEPRTRRGWWVVGGDCKFRRLHAHFRIIAPRYPIIKARGIKQRTHGPNLIIITCEWAPGPKINTCVVVMKMIGRAL
jgi:hypothetical protein